MEITTELAERLPNLRDIYDIQEINEESGYCFFDPSTMQNFSVRIHDSIYGGCVFVTSELIIPPQSLSLRSRRHRSFVVYMVTEDGDIQTIGSSQGYSRRYKAHALAKALGDEINAKRK